MLQTSWLCCLILLLPLAASAQDALVDRSYVELYELSGFTPSHAEAKSLRASMETERDHQVQTCEKNEKNLRDQLASSRRALKDLNKSSPREDSDTADVRNHIHSEIAALEQVARDSERECRHVIPAHFQIKLAKARLLESWPERRQETLKKIDRGEAPDRKHGDIDDVGYRKPVDGQEKDIPIGEHAMRQMAKGMEVEDAAVQRYIDDLAGTIAKNSDLKVPLHTTVLDSQEINSIGLPGGFLIVTSGLIAACETEAELAGVVSQQIAHIAARHGTRTSKRSVVAKLFVPATQIATGLLTGGVSNAGAYYGMDYGFQGLNVLVDRTLALTNAQVQKEADQLGIQYAWKAGFDPKGFIAFLDSIAARKDYPKTDRFFMTKLSLADRLIDAFTEIQYLPAKENQTVDSPEFQKVRDRVRGMTMNRPD